MRRDNPDPTHLFEVSDGVYLMSACTTSPERASIRNRVREQSRKLKRELQTRPDRPDPTPPR